MIAARALTAGAPMVAAGVVKLLGTTLRVTVSGDEALRPLWKAGRPLIYVVWHGRILLVPWLSLWLRRTRGARAPLVLASRSRDGDVAAGYVARFGLRAVRGSSSRGGDAALRRLVAAIRNGTDVVIVPDGPRGPSEQLQPGVVTLAALTGAPVVPLAVGARPGRLLRTWDRCLVPLPFARCALVFGPTLRVERDADRVRACKEVERALLDVTARADALAAGMAAR
jgi:lysophospholipid acyltransferase (LPLAT)-like uncharacterized protein